MVLEKNVPQYFTISVSISIYIYQLQNRKGRCRAAPLAEVTGWVLIGLKMTCRVASWYCGYIKAVKLDVRLLCEKIRNFYKTSAWTHVQFMWNKYFIAYKTSSCWQCWRTFVNNSLHALSMKLRTLQMIIHMWQQNYINYRYFTNPIFKLLFCPYLFPDSHALWNFCSHLPH